MLTATPNVDRLAAAAKAAGLKQTQKGLFGAGKGKADWEIEINPAGGFTLTRPGNDTGKCFLTTHAAWRGPVKLQREGDKIVQRVEMFLGSLVSLDTQWSQDAAEQQETHEFLASVLKRLPQWLDGVEEVAGWQPPSAKTLSEWLIGAGHEAAIDDEDNLRLALKRRGCDGQIRVDRGEGRLGFTMRLGEWNGLDENAEQAMLDLAGETNSRSRLVRIAWVEGEQGSRRCEAQVDLSGLPYDELLDGGEGSMWHEMIRATIDGLDLALRRLGLELNGLAEPSNSELAAAFHCDW